MFMVLSPWQCHWKNSPGSFYEYKTAPRYFKPNISKLVSRPLQVAITNSQRKINQHSVGNVQGHVTHVLNWDRPPIVGTVQICYVMSVTSTSQQPANKRQIVPRCQRPRKQNVEICYCKQSDLLQQKTKIFLVSLFIAPIFWSKSILENAEIVFRW